MKEKTRLNAAMLFASAIVMILETCYLHALNYISNFLQAMTIVSVAMLGIAAGGIGGYFLQRRGQTRLLPYLGLATGLAVVVATLNVTFFPSLMDYPVLLMLPFFFVSVVIAYLFTRLHVHHAYFWNMLGAAAGVLAVVLLVPRLQTENVIVLTILLAAAMGLLLAPWAPGARAPAAAHITLGVLALALLATNVPLAYFDFGKLARYPARKGEPLKVFQRVQQQGSKIRYTRDNLVARVDILEHPQKEKRKVYTTYQEGIVSDITQQRSPQTYYWDSRIPRAMIPDPSILVVGTSAEGVTKTARLFSKDNMVGIELNPGIVDLMEEGGPMYEFSRRAYEGFELQVTDARTYLEGTSRKFDFITMLNTHTRGRASDNAAQAQFLYSQEAFALALDHLTDRGALVLEEVVINKDSRRFASRVLSSAIAGMRLFGIKDHFEQHCYGWAFSPTYEMFVIKKKPFSQEESKTMDDYLAAEDEHTKKIGGVGFQIRIHPFQEIDHDFSRFVRDPAGSIARARQQERIVLAPTTDDNPFLYDITEGHPRLERMCWLSAISALLLVLLPSLVLFRRSLAGRALHGTISLLYFSLLGLGYFLVEMVLMQQYQLFLGSPIQALMVVLTAILLFSGLGSLLSARFAAPARAACLVAIPALLLACPRALPWLFSATQSLPLPVRVGVALLTLFPLFFCMGVPFPHGLGLLKDRFPAEHVALAYGVNGAFGTIGATLAMLISVAFGLSVTFYAGVGLYAVTLALLALLAGLARWQPASDAVAGEAIEGGAALAVAAAAEPSPELPTVEAQAGSPE